MNKGEAVRTSKPRLRVGKPFVSLKVLLVATLLIAGIQPLAALADELYLMTWRGTAYVQGADGKVIARHLTERDFVQKVAQDNGIDPRALVFVYRPDKHDTAVVWASNGGFVADVIQMEYQYTEVTSPTQALTVRQAFLFDEQHDSTIGSACGIERARRNNNGNLVSYSFRGSFQYAFPEQKAVYGGVFSTGARVKDTSGG